MALYSSKGKIFSISDVQSGDTQSGYHWQRCELILEIEGAQGSSIRQIFRVNGDAVMEIQSFKPGEKVEITFTIYAREYNGRWYNNLDLYKINRLSPAGKVVSTKEAPAAETEEPDLPF